MKSRVLFLLILLLGLVLRIYQVGNIPSSLYWDEASLGYNAYSISQTLRDEHGEYLPLGRFIAFGDYKAPGYIYVDSLVIKLFGLSEFSIRLPSVIAGLLLIAIAFLLSKEIFSHLPKKDQEVLAHLSALIVAISPWAIQMSRGAFEANLATFFSGFGLLMLIRFENRRGLKNLIFSAVFLSASIYTFNSHRVFIPLMVGAYLLITFLKKCFLVNNFNLKNLLDFFKYRILFVCLFALLLIPIFPHLVSNEGRLRFNEVTWLNDLDLIKVSNDRKLWSGNGLIGDLLHNRRIIYSQEFLKHYFDNLNPKFLFQSGDENPRLSSQNVGEFYWVELPLLLMGIYFMIRRRVFNFWWVLVWVLVAPIPASVARETPHALRVLNILPIPQIIVGYGLLMLSKVVIDRRINSISYSVLISIAYLLSILNYVNGYYKVYPSQYAFEWQDGYKQMIEYVRSVQDKYDYVYITNDYGRPYIYTLLYEKYDPAKYWQNRNVNRDWYGFWYVNSFDKFHFDDQNKKGRWLVVKSTRDDKVDGSDKIIYNSYGVPVFKIYSEMR